MPQRFRLANGLTVVFEEQHAARVAAFQVWVRAGSADEREGEVGLAHLHEHMLFKGTATRGPGEIANDIEGRGGEINAWTSFDQTVYHVVIASQFARHGLAVLCDAVRSSTFDSEELSREIEVVCEEIKRSLDMPARRASRDLFATAYLRHPYQRPVIGTQEAVRGHSRERVLGFYRRHYTPANLVLSAVGDFKEAELREWAQELLGGAWGQGFEGPWPRLAEPPLAEPRVLVREDDVREAYLQLAFPIVALDHPDTPALDVLSMVAGSGDASHLVRELKRKLGAVNDVHAYAYTPLDPGIFVTSITAPPLDVPRALEAAVAVLGRLKEVPVVAEELATMKALIESEAIYQRETVQGVARKLGFYEASAGGIEEEQRYLDKVAGLTPEVLLQAAQRYLDFDRCVLTALMPDAASLSADQARALLSKAGQSSPPIAHRARPALASRVVLHHERARREDLVVEKLPCGASVIVREEPAVPLVALRGVYAGGLRYETDLTNGLTALLARMWTRGTTARDAMEVSQALDALAGSMGGTGGRSSMSLRCELLSRHVEAGLELFADCLLHPAFSEEELARERALTLQDLATREDKPSSLAFELFARTLYTAHPYRLSPMGEPETVAGLSREQLAAYHRGYLHPSQLTLCVVGDVRADDVLTRAQAALGAGGPGALPVPEVLPEPPPAQRRVAHRALAKAQAHLVVGFLGARVSDPWRRPLEVLSTVLSGQGGRLFLELRDRRPMAYSISTLSVEGLDPGYFAVYMGTSPEKVDAALAGIHSELEKVRQDGISALELERAQLNLVGTHEIGLQRNSARAALIGLDHCYGLGADGFLRYADDTRAVTADQVREVARRVLDPAHVVEVVVGPRPSRQG